MHITSSDNAYSLYSSRRPEQCAKLGYLFSTGYQRIVCFVAIAASQCPMVVLRRSSEDGKSVFDFRVRRAVVQAWLDYMRSNNEFYRDINIGHTALLQLPDDDSVIDQLPTLIWPDEDTSSAVDEGPQQNVPDNVPDLTTYSFVQQQDQQPSEMALLQQKVLLWPSHTTTTTPVDYNMKGFWSYAFPSLFPNAAADLTCPRSIGISLHEWTIHLLSIQGSSFMKHHRFLFTNNAIQHQRRVFMMTCTYVSNHPDQPLITVEDVRNMVSNNDNSVFNNVRRWSANVPGTGAYWK